MFVPKETACSLMDSAEGYKTGSEFYLFGNTKDLLKLCIFCLTYEVLASVPNDWNIGQGHCQIMLFCHSGMI